MGVGCGDKMPCLDQGWMIMLYELRSTINSTLEPENKRKQSKNSQVLLFSHAVGTLKLATAV